MHDLISVRTPGDEGIGKLLVPLPAAGFECGTEAGSVCVFAVNRLRWRKRVVTIRSCWPGASSDIGAGETRMFGPFPEDSGRVAVASTRVRGLYVCAVLLPDPKTVLRYRSPGIGLGD